MPGYDVTDFQAADYSVGRLIADCYSAMDDTKGPSAFKRFLKRPTKEKIYFCRNDDVQSVLQRIAKHETEPSTAVTPDLPCIVYYRQFDLAFDTMSRATVFHARRIEPERQADADTGLLRGLEATTIPIKLTYSLLVLAWDRPTAERMALSWWGWVAPIFREHTRILTPYTIDGEAVQVPGSIDIPREFASSAETLDDGRRLFGMRTQFDLNTQVVYGQHFETVPSFCVTGMLDDTAGVKAGGKNDG